MKLFSFRNLRITVLLLALAVVAVYSKNQLLYSTAWLEPLPVTIFPINADGHPATERYIQGLSDRSFADIDEFFAREGRRYKLLERHPTRTRLGPEVEALPPPPPEQGGNVLGAVLWSLKLRYWAWQYTPDNDSNQQRVRMFVLYQQGDEGEALTRSLGLQKGLLGVVNAFALAEQNAQNNIVIAHEVMHTLGASDRYDENSQPVFPDGFASPNSDPRYPQQRAEIMAGRIPLTPTESIMAKSLKSCVVGTRTAQEINWFNARGS